MSVVALVAPAPRVLVCLGWVACAVRSALMSRLPSLHVHAPVQAFARSTAHRSPHRIALLRTSSRPSLASRVCSVSSPLLSPSRVVCSSLPAASPFPLSSPSLSSSVMAAVQGGSELRNVINHTHASSSHAQNNRDGGGDAATAEDSLVDPSMSDVPPPFSTPSATHTSDSDNADDTTPSIVSRENDNGGARARAGARLHRAAPLICVLTPFVFVFVSFSLSSSTAASAASAQTVWSSCWRVWRRYSCTRRT